MNMNMNIISSCSRMLEQWQKQKETKRMTATHSLIHTQTHKQIEKMRLS